MQQNKQAKESTKPPLKVHGITGERFLSKTNSALTSLATVEGMLERCREFHALMAVDDEVKVGEDADEFREHQSASLEVDAAPVQKRGRKRKSEAGSATGTPKRARPARPKHESRRSMSTSSQGDPDGDYGE
jgi:hypothetical protein